ncbi:growth factor receptor-bound protein 14 isoform X1 [Anoplolepis gracilipes]|uniref:growth factor receptor-bound protein 14 isoform X1 n=1 Tax=Anoplolepis gracilipes TaxID=354296 RepID=UPI003B9F55E7
MAGDSADASLLTSAIEEDPTESPNVECPERSEIHHYDHPRIEDAPRKGGKDQNVALLADFDDIIDYIDCCSLFQNWLSRICNWFPKMCSCIDGNSTLPNNRAVGRSASYERLGSDLTIFELSSPMRRSRRGNQDLIDSERQEELRFYNNDHSFTTVVVEKDLRTIDLCELLKVKRNVMGTAWSIIEMWPKLGIERTLEDHEDILAVHRELEMFASRYERRFYFSEDFLKYEPFVNPKQFFPADMVAFPSGEDRSTFTDADSAIRNYLLREDSECPQVFSMVWMRHVNSNGWRKMYMLLQGRKLYTAKKTIATLPKRPLDSEHLITLAHLSDYNVYRIPNAKRVFGAPFEWGVCLRPNSNAEAEDTEAGEPGIKVIAFENEKSRACWLTAMRLAKYGKQLRENYRAFKNKQCDQNGSGSPKEQYSSYNVSNESIRSRVAMDFTGSVGRIVEDPKEAKDIAENEGMVWRRRWRPFSRTPPGCAMMRLHGLDGGIHVLQPWFHGGLKRDIAAAIIRDHGTVDGVFLVRESKSNPGAFVLTYKYNDKVFHAQIQPIFDERRNCWLYTLDKGATKFYDLLQLVEFYQLNAGSLPTRLTHYVQNGVKPPLHKPEDGGASPSPPEGSSQRVNSTDKVADLCSKPSSI